MPGEAREPYQAGPGPLSADPGGQQVGADAEQFGDPLDRAGGVEDHGAVDRVVHPLGEVAEQERRALHADQVRHLEPCGTQLIAQLPRPVAEAAERAGTQRRQQPGPFDLRGQLAEVRVLLIEPFRQLAVETRRPAGDGGREEDASIDNSTFWAASLGAVMHMTASVKPTRSERIRSDVLLAEVTKFNGTRSWLRLPCLLAPCIVRASDKDTAAGCAPERPFQSRSLM